MKKMAVLLCTTMFLSTLSGCAEMTKQDVGVLTGGAIGGAVGSLFGGGSGKIVAAVGGTVLGAFIGGSIGKSMDDVDRMKVTQALEQNRLNQTTSWHNPDNGNSYKVTPTKTYYQNSRPCRDFTTKAIIGGKSETIYGRACRMDDGTWKMTQ